MNLTHPLSKQETPSNFPADRFRRDDGLTIVHQYLPATPVVVADVWVRAGASAEPMGWNGMAHFLEHAIFKGTDLLPPGAFDLEIETRGGMTNAATSHDYAHFFIATAAQHFSQTLPHLAELLLHAAIPEEEFFRERDVVLEEIRQSQDHPDSVAFEALMEMVYQFHPYRQPILGTQASLMQFGPDHMRCFHRSHYQPENMTVVVVGGIPQRPTLELIDRCFSDFASPLACPISIVEAEPPITGVRRRTLQIPRLELARLNLAWMGPGVEQIRDAYGLDLLSVLLAGGRSTRLVRELREERQFVQWIYSSFSLQRDSSLFTISAALDAEFLEVVEQLIGDRLYQLQTTPISEVELARAKRQLCSDFAFSTETPAQLAGLYGYYQTLSAAEIAVSYPAQIQSLEASELQQIASRYLSPYHYAVTVAVGE